MAELLVRAALTHFDETKRAENRDDLARLENRNAWHSVHDDGLRADEFCFELGLAIAEQHGNHV